MIRLVLSACWRRGGGVLKCFSKKLHECIARLHPNYEMKAATVYLFSTHMTYLELSVKSICSCTE